MIVKKKPKLYFGEEDKESSRKPIEIRKPEIKKGENAGKHKEIKHMINRELQTNSNLENGKARKNGMALLKAEIESELQSSKETVNPEKKGFRREGRVYTGIPGLDEVMEGGFRRNTINLVGGGAGSGKSIFTMQFLIEGIDKHNEPGIYISFEEDQEKVLMDFERFDWKIREKVEKNKLTILYFTPEQVEHVLEKGGGVVRDAIESMKAKRLVVDSLTAFTLLHDTELAKRKTVLRLFEAVKKWGVTAMMTAEEEPDPEKHDSTILEFEVDGVILLYNERKGDIRERSLEVFKMRGTVHSAKIFPMSIGNKGIIIYPEETVF